VPEGARRVERGRLAAAVPHTDGRLAPTGMVSEATTKAHFSNGSRPVGAAGLESAIFRPRLRSWYHERYHEGLSGSRLETLKCRKPASEPGFWIVGAAGFEPATFRPPAERQSV
jgi:hypothetical protein